MRKKSLAVSLSIVSILLLGAVGYLGYSTFEKYHPSSSDPSSSDPSSENPSSDNSNPVATDTVNHGIRLMLANSIGDVKTFTYSFEPASATGLIALELSCASDSSYAVADYISASLNSSSQTVSVTCKKVFTKQLSVKVYSVDNPTVYGIVHVDYQDRITATHPTLTIAEGAHISPAVTVDSTGGSLTVSKDVTDGVLSFAQSFVDTARTKLTAKMEAQLATYHTNTGDGQKNDSTDKGAGFHTNLIANQTDSIAGADWYLTNNFVASEFLKRYRYEVNFMSESSWENETNYTFLSDLSQEDLLTMFNGTNAVFHYSYKVNSVAYNQDFGLAMTAIAMTKMNVSTGGIIF